LPGGPFHNLLPQPYLSGGVLQALSLDAQIYFSCSGCGMYLRSNPGLILDRAWIGRSKQCPNCATRDPELKLYFHRIWLSCDDCGREFGILTTGFFFGPECPDCGSERCSQAWSKPHEDLPPVFFNIQDDPRLDAHTWGLNADADELVVSRELGLTRTNPEAIRYLVPAALFADRLATWNHYSSGTWRLRNLEGILLHRFYKQTGVLHAGSHAFSTLVDLTEGELAPADPVDLGMVCYNAAAAGFSLLNRVQAQMAVLGDLEKIRSQALGVAQRALEAFAVDRSLEPDVRMVEVARINYLLGDLTRKPVADARRLREAVRYFDLALAEPAISAELRHDITVSRTNALLALGPLDVDRDAPVRSEVDYGGTDWAGLPPLDKCIWLRNAAIQLEHDGRDEAAEEALYQATEIAATELGTTRNGAGLASAVRLYHPFFDDLARLNVKLGRRRAALEAVETVRALVLSRQSTSVEEAEREFAEAVMIKGLTDLLSIPPEPPRFSEFRASPESQRAYPLTGDALTELAAAGWPQDTALCSFVFASQSVTVITTVLDDDGWVIDGEQWHATADELIQAVEITSLTEPGGFRGRRLAAFCAKMSPILLRGLVPLLRRHGVRRVAISAPGIFSHIPFEGLEYDGVLFGEEFELFFVPSLRSTAAMARRQTTSAQPGRILVVGYRGTDLPEASRESAQIMELCEGSADLLDPDAKPKSALLDAISADAYELLHFACHGSFDPIDEVRSALYLGGGPGESPIVLEARELTARAFTRRLVVVLSACESGLTSWGLSGDCTGLTGAFLRMGARGVIGSRWAVFDDAAHAFMRHMYTAINQGMSPQRAVAHAQREMRRTNGIDDWAAFSYLGLPDLTTDTERV
jgi:hypothetical protein